MGHAPFILNSSIFLMVWQKKGQLQLWKLCSRLSCWFSTSILTFKLRCFLCLRQACISIYKSSPASYAHRDMWSLHPAEKQCFQKQKWKAKFIQLQAQNKDSKLKGTIIILISAVTRVYNPLTNQFYFNSIIHPCPKYVLAFKAGIFQNKTVSYFLPE